MGRIVREKGYWVRRLLWIGGKGGEEHTTHLTTYILPLGGREPESEQG